MSTRTRQGTAGLLLGALIGGVVLASPRPATAAGELQTYFDVTSLGVSIDRSTTTLLQSSLPAPVTLTLSGLPDSGYRPDPAASYRFSLRTPVTQQADRGSTTVPATTPTRTASVTFTVPATTPCGTYPVSVETLTNLSSGQFLWTAVGSVVVGGCPREFDVRNPVVLRTAPGPIAYQFAGRYFPHRFSRQDEGIARVSPISIAVDGVVRDTVPNADSTEENLVFDRRVDLDLACGPHTVTAGTPELGVLETRTIGVQCPALTLSRDRFDRPELPEDVTASVTGILQDEDYQVLLDGVLVSDEVSETTGSGPSVVPLPARLECGLHYVQVTQPHDPAPFPTVDPLAPPGGPADPPTSLPPLEPDPIFVKKAPTPGLTPGPAAAAPALLAPPVVDDLLATAPLTVVCPGTPLLTVTPDLTVDNRQPQAYVLSAVGFSDSDPVTITAGPTTLTVPPGTTTPLGEFLGTVSRRLPCGPTAFTMRDTRGRVAADVAVQRCPELALDPVVVDRRALPRTVAATATGFGRVVPVDVLLDGTDVGDGVTDTAGKVVRPVPLTAATGCGTHVVTVRQRTPEPPPAAQALLVVTCSEDALLAVSPEVVPTGFTARVTGENLPPGPVLLVWDLGGGVQRLAMGKRTATVLPDGTLSVSVLLLRGEQTGARTLVALDPEGPGAGDVLAVDEESTLVVLSSFQPGRRSSSATVGLLGRR